MCAFSGGGCQDKLPTDRSHSLGEIEKSASAGFLAGIEADAIVSDFDFAEVFSFKYPDSDGIWPVSYTHLTLPTNREV